MFKKNEIIVKYFADVGTDQRTHVKLFKLTNKITRQTLKEEICH